MSQPTLWILCWRDPDSGMIYRSPIADRLEEVEELISINQQLQSHRQFWREPALEQVSSR